MTRKWRWHLMNPGRMRRAMKRRTHQWYHICFFMYSPLISCTQAPRSAPPAPAAKERQPRTSGPPEEEAGDEHDEEAEVPMLLSLFPYVFPAHVLDLGPKVRSTRSIVEIIHVCRH